MLNSREIATLVWSAFVVLFLFWHPKFRPSWLRFLRVLLSRAIVLHLLAMGLYIWGAVGLLSAVGAWSERELKVSIAWSLTVAPLLTLDVTQHWNEAGLFRRILKVAFGASVLLEFATSLAPFPLPVELFLLPSLAFVAILIVVAAQKQEHRAVVAAGNCLVSLVGLAALAYLLWRLFRAPAEMLNVSTVAEFMMPLVLTLAFLPFLALTRISVAYETVFGRLRFFVSDVSLRRFVRMALMVSIGPRVLTLERWADTLPATELRSRDDVRQSIEVVKAKF